ncbi:uncharacterized protein LOC135401306 [Ornithodoros turicata]|uniref:uncharacterized protein LOC135401306 n=1 Tax=Ornithodoros turicata TaxID=34597 RepID=UPI0031391579
MPLESPSWSEQYDQDAASDDEDSDVGWEAFCDDDSGGECLVSPRPPQFRVPPPPLPPSLCAGSGGVVPDDLQFCEVRPVGAEFTTSAAFPSLPIIAVCSSVVLVAVFVASFLLWKHKKKVQNFLPCKSQHQGPCDLRSANGASYNDVLLNHHPTRLPSHVPHGPDTHTLTPIELLDVKYGSYGAPHLATLSQSNYTFRPSLHQELHHRTLQHQRPTLQQHHLQPRHATTSHRTGHGRDKGARRRQSNKNKEQFNPIYEEVSGHSDEKPRGYYSEDSDVEEDARSIGSEDEFAEDELSLGEYPRPPASGSSSLQGSTGGDLCPPDAAPVDSGSHNTGSRRGRRQPPTLNRLTGGTGKHSHSLERNKNTLEAGLQAKQNYYLSKSALAFDQQGVGGGRDSGLPYSSVDLDLTHQHGPSVSPPEPAPPQGDFGVPGGLPTVFNPGFVIPNGPPRPPPPPAVGSRAPPPPPALFMGPDCQYPPQGGGFSTFLQSAPEQQQAASTENIYASIDEEDCSNVPFTIDGRRESTGGGRKHSGASLAGRGGTKGSSGQRTMPRESAGTEQPPPYGDIRPVFVDPNRTLCT